MQCRNFRTGKIICVLVLLGLSFSISSSFAETLTLDQALSEALRNNPALLASQGQVRTAEGALAEVKSSSRIHFTGAAVGLAQQQAPEIPAVPGQPGVEVIEKENAYFDVSAEKLLYSSGRVENATKRSADLLESEQLRNERTRQMVILDTRSAFYSVLAAQRNVDTADADLKSTQEHLTVAETRYKTDTSPRYDVLRAKVQNAQAKQRLIEAQNTLIVTKQNLARAMGAPRLDIGVVAEEAVETSCAPLLDDLISSALKHRPDLSAARSVVAAAQAELNVAKAENKPSISTSAGYREYVKDTLMQLDGWYANLAVTVPIGDGGFTSARKQQARGLIEQALANVKSIENAVISEVKQFYSDYVSAKAREDVAITRLEEAQEAYRLATLRYNSGVAPSVEITDAQSALTNARNELVKTRLDISIAQARLDYAVGFNALSNGGKKK